MKEKRPAIVAVALLSILALICWLRIPVDPPTPTVMVGDIPVEVIRGTYTWKTSTYAVASDSPSPPDIIQHTGRIAQASGGQTVTFRFDKRPLELQLRIWNGSSPTDQKVDMKGDQGGSFVIPTAPGRYVYEILTAWKQGTVTHVFAVEVK